MKKIGLLSAVLLALACGGAGGGNLDGGNEMPVATRTAAIDKVEDKVESLYGQALSVADRNTQIAAFMRSQPEFSDAQITADECVWGRFTDGRFMVVVNNRMPQWFGGKPSGNYVRKEQLAPDKIATSTKARLFHSFGLNFGQQQHPIDQMGQWLKDAGYTLAPQSEGDARLATLRGVSGDGFFYFNTHGGSFDFSSTEKVYCAGSSTLRNDANEALPEIKADLEAKRVVYMTAPNGEHISILGIDVPRVDTRYAITSKFVDSYWNFGPNAVVFMNACWSGFTGVANGAQGFFFACHQKGAGAYLGWTDKVSTPVSENAPQFFVDRMTAANKYNKESPDQRAFFVTEIVKDMHDKGIVPGGGAADLVVKLKSQASNVGLRPSIEYMLMNETTNQLMMVGKFGDQPGEVFVNGVKAGFDSWTNELVLAKIDPTGPNAFGDVTVKVHGKESNKRQLTKWVTDFSFTETGSGTLKCTINAKVVIRADFAKQRTKPGETPKLRTAIPFYASPESTCTFLASGEHRDGQGKLLDKWTGSGPLTFQFPPIQSPSPNWSCGGAYDPATGDVGISLLCGGPKVTLNGSFMPGGGGLLKKLNTTTWVIPAETQLGSPTFTFTQANPARPPAADTQY